MSHNIPDKIMSSPQMKKFLSTIHNDATRQNSLWGLSLYFRDAKATKVDDLFGSVEKIEGLIEHWIESQKNQRPPVVGTTIGIRVNIVKQFYEMNRIALAWKLISKQVPKSKAKKSVAWERSDLQMMLKVAKVREQAIIPLYASCGMRRGALPALNVEDFIPIDEWGIFDIIGYRGEEEEFHTYCTPEARKNIEAYWDYRKRHGETLSPSSPAFRQEWNIDDPKSAENPKRLAERTISGALRELALKVGLRKKITGMNGNYGSIRHKSKIVHGIRKFFETTLLDLGFDENWVDALEGHKMKGLRENYYTPKDQTILLGTSTSDGKFRKPGYVDLMKELVINDEERAKVRVRELEQKIKGEEYFQKQLDEQGRQIADLSMELYQRDPDYYMTGKSSKPDDKPEN
jgi:integrase